MMHAALGSGRGHRIALVGILAVYLFVSLRNLEVVPPVYEDEPWQASTGWKIATEGTFGSDLFAGFYGMERRYYGFMPLHPILLAATFKLGGLGLAQARLESVMMGFLTLFLTYALGRRLFGAPVGLLALGLMISVRLTGTSPSQLTGILGLDIPRIARYDVLVPVFGLASLHAVISAERQGSLVLYGLSGLLAALSGLSHVYGVFWFVALAGLAIWNRAGKANLLALGLGFAVPWCVYATYVLADLPSWRGQVYGYGSRFLLRDPGWYWTNLTQEYRRYGPGLGPSVWEIVLRPGFWAAVVAIPAASVALGWRALNRADRAARAILFPAVIFPVLFALLISLKLSNYLYSVVPVFAIVVAWGGVALWRRARQFRLGCWVRVALALLLLSVAVEGAVRMLHLERAAAVTTPYSVYVERIRAAMPPARNVVGLHRYWFGMEDLEYRSWAVPVTLAHPDYSPEPQPATTTLDAIDPQVLLIDPQMRAYLDNPPPGDAIPTQIRRWMREQDARRVRVVEDPTYGRMEIYFRALR